MFSRFLWSLPLYLTLLTTFFVGCGGGSEGPGPTSPSPASSPGERSSLDSAALEDRGQHCPPEYNLNESPSAELSLTQLQGLNGFYDLVEVSLNDYVSSGDGSETRGAAWQRFRLSAGNLMIGRIDILRSLDLCNEEFQGIQSPARALRFPVAIRIQNHSISVEGDFVLSTRGRETQPQGSDNVASRYFDESVWNTSDLERAPRYYYDAQADKIEIRTNTSDNSHPTRKRSYIRLVFERQRGTAANHSRQPR